MNANTEYNRAIEQAKSNYSDLMEHGADAVGSDALAFLDSILTPEEIAESNLRVALIGELIKTKHEKGLIEEL